MSVRVSSLGWLVLMAASTQAGNGYVGPVPCGTVAVAGPVCVEKTIMVPTWVTEKRKVLVTECRPVERVRQVAYYRQVPEIKQVKQECMVMHRQVEQRVVVDKVQVPVTRYVDRVVNVRVPVWKNVKREVEVSVPRYVDVKQQYMAYVWDVEKRVGKRMTWKTVAVKQKQLVAKDKGHWEEQQVAVACPPVTRRPPHLGWLRRWHCPTPCGFQACDSCEVAKPVMMTCRVWVPNVVHEEIEVVVHKCEPVEETYEFEQPVCRPVKKTRIVKKCVYEVEKREVMQRVCAYEIQQRKQRVPVCEYEIRERKRVVCDVKLVPKKMVRHVQVRTCKLVKEVRDEKYIAYETHQVEKEVEVPVCRMVEQKVTVRVNSCYAPPRRCLALLRGRGGC